VEFIGLHDEARNQIRQWISLELQVNESVEGIPFDEETEPVKFAPATFEPENAIRFPETETTGRVPENPNPNSISEDAGEVPRSVERVLQYSRTKSTTSDVAENGPGTTTPLFAWAELEARLNREINARERTSFSRSSGRLIGLTLSTVLLLPALFLLVYRSQESKHSPQHVGAIASTMAPGFSTDTSANPTNPPANATPPSHGTGFMLQVGAMTHKENADALAEILRRRYFPAFVSPPGTDRFYRVVVGPYRDADAALTAKRELKGEGFESIRTPWNPLTEPAPQSTGLR
jgi:cell division protein FtsN